MIHGHESAIATKPVRLGTMATAAAAAAKSLQSCPTLCNPIDGSPPGSPVPGILQARKLEWLAISFSNAWKWKVKGKSLSRVRLFATAWTVAYQAPPSMGFPGKNTGVGWHCLLQEPPQDVLIIVSKPASSHLPFFPFKMPSSFYFPIYVSL